MSSTDTQMFDKFAEWDEEAMEILEKWSQENKKINQQYK